MYEYWIETLIFIDLGLIAFIGKWIIGHIDNTRETITELKVEIAELRVRLDECNCD